MPKGAKGCADHGGQGCAGKGWNGCAVPPDNDASCRDGCCQFFRVLMLNSQNPDDPTLWSVDGEGVVHITYAPTGFADLVSNIINFECPANADAMTRLVTGEWQYVVDEGFGGTLTSVATDLSCPPANDPEGTAWAFTPPASDQPLFDGVVVQVYCHRATYSSPGSDQTLTVAGLIGVGISERDPVSVWNSLATYAPGDRSVQGARLYTANNASTNQMPPNPAYWDDSRPVLSGDLTYVPTTDRTWVSAETGNTGWGAMLMSDGRYWDNVRLSASVEPSSSSPKASLTIITSGGTDAQWSVTEGRWFDPMGARGNGTMTDFPMRDVTLGVAP
jgi:hypothetical protein